MKETNNYCSSIVKVTKWIVIALGDIVNLFLALFAMAIVSLFK